MNVKNVPVRLPRIRKRTHRCYELCGLGMLNDGVEGWTLAHGGLLMPIASGEMLEIAHAWLVAPDGTIYDAVVDAIQTGDSYRPDRTYTQMQAAMLMSSTGHFGPWDERISWFEDENPASPIMTPIHPEPPFSSYRMRQLSLYEGQDRRPT